MKTTLNCLALLVLIGGLVEIVAVDFAGQAAGKGPFKTSRHLQTDIFRSYQAISGCPRSRRRLNRLCKKSCTSKSSPKCLDWYQKLATCCDRRCDCGVEEQSRGPDDYDPVVMERCGKLIANPPAQIQKAKEKAKLKYFRGKFDNKVGPTYKFQMRERAETGFWTDWKNYTVVQKDFNRLYLDEYVRDKYRGAHNIDDLFDIIMLGIKNYPSKHMESSLFDIHLHAKVKYNKKKGFPKYVKCYTPANNDICQPQEVEVRGVEKLTYVSFKAQYPECPVDETEYWNVGDGICDDDETINSSLCQYDGGDCLSAEDSAEEDSAEEGSAEEGSAEEGSAEGCGFGNDCAAFDQFKADHPGCDIDSPLKNSLDGLVHPSHIGSGICSGSYNTEACNYEGGDCIEENERVWAEYPNCTFPLPWRIGDGTCDVYLRNVEECGYDSDGCIIEEESQ